MSKTLLVNEIIKNGLQRNNILLKACLLIAPYLLLFRVHKKLPHGLIL